MLFSSCNHLIISHILLSSRNQTLYLGTISRFEIKNLMYEDIEEDDAQLAASSAHSPLALLAGSAPLLEAAPPLTTSCEGELRNAARLE